MTDIHSDQAPQLARFYACRELLLTGATGFLGKVRPITNSLVLDWCGGAIPSATEAVACLATKSSGQPGIVGQILFSKEWPMSNKGLLKIVDDGDLVNLQRTCITFSIFFVHTIGNT